MSSVDVPSKNELRKLWMFSGVTNNAQHLNVCGVSSKAGGGAMRFNMVPLQIIFISTFFATTTFFYDLVDYFATVIFTFACTAFPVWMIWSFWHSCFCSTFRRTILAGSTIAFSNLKMFTASLACTVKQCFIFSWAQFVGTRNRTSICFPPNMCVRSSKLSTTSSTGECYMPTPFNLSLEY